MANFNDLVVRAYRNLTPAGWGFTGDSADVHLKSSIFGTYPQYLYRYETVTGTASALLTVSSVQSYSRAIIVISGTGAETVTITGINGSGNPQALLQADGSTATTTLGDGTYYLDRLVCTDLVFTKSASTTTTTIDVDLKS